MPKRKPPPEPSTLTAVIEGKAQSYYLSQEPGLGRVDDEAIIDLVGRIEEISPAHKRHQGKQIEMSLVCSRSFSRDDPTPTTDKPFLLSVNLRGEQRSLMAYMPADAFWSVSSMIVAGEITHVEARFGPIHRGNADLLSLHWRGPAGP